MTSLGFRHRRCAEWTAPDVEGRMKPFSFPASSPLERAVPRLIPLARAAVLLGLSARTLRRRVRDGSLPAHRIRSSLYIRPEELRAFVERHIEISIE